MSEQKEHLARILQLEEQLRQKEQDIFFFKNELKSVNERLKKMIEHLREEVNLTKKIQNILIPTELPSISGFEFSTKFSPSLVGGGDYFDIFNHTGKMKFGVLLANSSSYTASALLMSVLLKFSGSGWAQFENSGENLKEIISGLQKEMEKEDSANLFFAIVDRQNFSMDFSGSGSILSYYYSSERNELDRLEFSREAVTSENALNIVNKKVVLNPNDKLIACTPGFLKLVNSEGKNYTEEMLRKSIIDVAKESVHEIRNEILYQSEKFVQEEQIKKDRTVVIFEVKNRIVRLAR